MKRGAGASDRTVNRGHRHLARHAVFYWAKPARLAAWAELTKACKANPDLLTLQFLEAYRLWFLGERDRFHKVVLKVRDSEVIERFLRATRR